MIRARVIWEQSGSKDMVDCEFAYPLREGDQFVIGAPDDRYLCKVEHVLHVPVNIDSGNIASVMYMVKRSKADAGFNYWEFIKDTIQAALLK